MIADSRCENSTSAEKTSVRRRLAYSIAAGAAGAVAASASTEANAAIVYSGSQNLSVSQFSATNLDINGDAQGDVLLKNYVFGGSPYQGATVNFAPGKLVGFSSGNAYVTALASGSPINSTTANPSFFGSMAYGTHNPNAQFNSANLAFFGLSFPAGANLYYGWVRVTINNTAGTFVINDWAYNNVSGSPINAGQGLPIPEPGTLGMLAAGALGVTALRRKQRTAE